MELKQAHNAGHAEAPCPDLPELKRLNYFYGQLLGVNDFRSEQAYFREKLRLHNRCLHGFGTVCGLKVVPVSQSTACEPDADRKRKELEAELASLRAQHARLLEVGDRPAATALEPRIEEIKRKIDALGTSHGEKEDPVRVSIECGLALDCEGNEIIVRRPFEVDPWHYLSPDDRKKVADSTGTDVYLTICYCEQPVDPVRPVLVGACGATPECAYGKLRGAFRVQVGVEQPQTDARCEPCCTECKDPCLLLAVIRGFRKGTPVSESMIDNSVRRLVGTYPPTTITGISWTHGATYSAEEAAEILGTDNPSGGLKVSFSRPVLTSTLVHGVVDLWVIEGGRTKRAGVYYLEGDFQDLDRGRRSVDSFRFRYQGDETLDPGDRVIVTIRCAFILDECCQPVDGVHVGGRVPILDAALRKFDRSATQQDCSRPHAYGPWTSGARTPGSTFESWFYIESKDTRAAAGRRQPR